MRYQNILFLDLMLMGGSHCQPADEIPTLDGAGRAALREFQALPASSKVHPAPENEPGAPLLICGALIRKETGEPIPGTSILAYHTDIKGHYRQSEKGNPETARISGTVQTDEQGHFLLSTILPGKYDNKGEGGHIHLMVEGANPRGYVFQFTQYSNAVDRQFIKDNDQHFLVELMRDKEGHLVGFLDVAVKGVGE